MEWKKLADTDEVLVFEKFNYDNKMTVRVEARFLEDGWQIIKRYDLGDEDYYEEYFAETFEERNKILVDILEEPDLTPKHIRELRKEQRKKIVMNLERIYKENNVEKWLFSVNGNIMQNFAIVKFNGEIILDIIVNAQYKHLEKKIVKELLISLGLDNERLNYNIYFYTKKRCSFNEEKISAITHKLDSD